MFQRVAKTLGTIRLKVLAMFMVLMVAAAVACVVCWGQADREIADSEAQGLAQMQVDADAVARLTVIVVKSLADIEQLALLAARHRSVDHDDFYAIALAALRSSMANSPLGISELSVFDRGGAELLHEGSRHGLEPGAEQESGFGRPWKDSGGQIVLRWTSPPDSTNGFVVQMTLDTAALSNMIGVVLPDARAAASRSSVALIRMDDFRFIARSQRSGPSLDTDFRVRFPWMGEIVRQGFGSRHAESPVFGYDLMVGFRTLPKLGLIAASQARAEDMLALAQLRAQLWRQIPFAGLAVGLVMLGLLLFWTERQHTQAKLAAERHARAEIDTLVQGSPAMLFRGVLDAQGHFTLGYITQNSQAIIGWESDHLADIEALWRRAAPEALQGRADNYVAALHHGRSVFECRADRPDGDHCWLRSEVVVVQRHEDGGADVVGSLSNVTRERELAAQSLIQNRMATVGEIATSIGHELSQPLTVINMAASYAKLLTDEMDEAHELADQIDTVVSQSTRATEIIQQLRRYGHAGGGVLGPVDVRKAVSGAMVLAGRPLLAASVTVEEDLPHDLPMVQGRLIQVEQVLMNLIFNARDAMMAMPASERRLRISAEVGDDVVIHVADSGPGVPARLIDKVFEPFFTTKEVGVGTGLGLPLCRTMMEEFGGSISVRNADQGAIFSLRFTRAAALCPKHEAVRV